MAELNPAWALENRADHHSNSMRRTIEALTGRGEGVRGSADLAVTQRGAGANMSVDVAKGSCVIYGDENEFQGVYGCVNDATVNVVVAAADPTNPRRDLIVARVRDDFYSGGTKAWALEVVQGTAAASPADPTVPSNTLVLARVAVAAAASSVVTANITDLRPFLGIPILFGNSARPPGTLYGPYSQEPSFKPTLAEPAMFVETDTDRLTIFDGSNRIRAAHYSSAGRTGGTWRRTANQAAGAGAFTTVTYPTEDADSDGFLTPTSGTCTIQVAGLYAINFSFTISGSSGAAGAMEITAGGIAHFASVINLTAGGFGIILPLAVNDTVQTIIFSSNAVNINPARLDVYRLAA